MKRRLSYILVLVCALTIFLTGCSSGNETPTNSIVSNSAAKAIEKKEIAPETTTSDGTGEANNTNLKVRESDEINATVELFVEALKSKDSQKFQSLISKNGLVVIRNFVTGGNGTRGKDIRDYYSIESIPKELQFPVKDEISINPKELFEGTVNKDGKGLPINQISKKLYNFRDNGSEPQILALEKNELVLTESQLIDGLPVGEFAVFEKVQGKYYVRAIMDFR